MEELRLVALDVLEHVLERSVPEGNGHRLGIGPGADLQAGDKKENSSQLHNHPRFGQHPPPFRRGYAAVNKLHNFAMFGLNNKQFRRL